MWEDKVFFTDGKRHNHKVKMNCQWIVVSELHKKNIDGYHRSSKRVAFSFRFSKGPLSILKPRLTIFCGSETSAGGFRGSIKLAGISSA